MTEGVMVCDTELDRRAVPVVGVAAMFSGEAEYKTSLTSGMPFVVLGTGDYAIEWFIKGRPNSAPFDAGIVNSGLVTPGGGETEGAITFGMEVGEASSIISLATLTARGFGLPMSGAWTPANWTHACISSDRAGLSTLYVDGTSVDTVDISGDVATDVGALPVHPMLGGQTNIIRYDTLTEDDNSVDSSLVVLSSFAIHARQLTPTEVQDNSDAKVVGLYAETFIRYLFSSFVDAAGASITPAQETTLASIGLMPKFGLPSPQASELFVPIGTPGTVFIEDTSGNAGHWPLKVQTSYDGLALANRGVCGFATTGAS